MVNFPTPAVDEARHWLEENTADGTDVTLLLNLAAGAPLRVNRFDSEFLKRRRAIQRCLEKVILKDPSGIDMAGKLANKEAPAEVYDILYEMFSDALRLSMTGSNKMITNSDIQDFIKVINQNCSATKLLQTIEHINFCRKTIGGTTNPNPQLLLESLLIDIAGVDPAIA